MATAEDEDEGAYVEQECTMDFTDDTPTSNARTTASSRSLIYHEFDGEDYSSYLQEDVSPVQNNIYMEPTPPPMRMRKGRRKSGTEQVDQRQVEGEYVYGSDGSQRSTKDIVKDRVSKWLNTVRGSKYNNPTWDSQGPASGLAAFSYADTKIPTLLAADERRSYGRGGPGSDSGIDTRSFKTPSDLGYTEAAGPLPPPARSRGAPPAKNAAYSSREGGGRAEGYYPPPPVAPLRRRSRSAVNLHQERDGNTGRGAGGRAGGEEGGVNMAAVQGKLTNAWRKLSSSLSKGRRTTDGRQGAQGAGGSELSYSNDYEDIRL